MSNALGHEMYALLERLYPMPRFLTGDAVRETLRLIQREYLPELVIHEVPTGTQAFDWIVPKEWNVWDAYIITPDGEKICDFQKLNLHVVGYSIPVDKEVSLEELQEHLHSLPEQPDAVPYVTSYYQERWGFCIAHRQRQQLKPGTYRVVIRSELKEGSLTYGEALLPGERDQEVLLSTYICHPSLANEVSGPVVTTFLGKWLRSRPRRYTYRILFLPETIGALVYLSQHLEHLKRHVIAGFQITCVGDDRAYSFLPSRMGNTLADRIALHTLKHMHPDFIRYSFLNRGSDERQYCAPGIDLPVVSIMRSKYHEYPEYHTSLDNLGLVSPSGLYGAFEVLQRALECLERNEVLQVTVLGEPQLGRRGLYPTLSIKSVYDQTFLMMNLLAYADGKHDLLAIAERLQVPMWELFPLVDRLKEENLLVPVEEAQS